MYTFPRGISITVNSRGGKIREITRHMARNGDVINAHRDVKYFVIKFIITLLA